MTDTTDKLTMQAETRGVQQATDELNKFAGAVGGVGVQSEKTERSTTSLDNKFAALERRFGTAGGQAAQFERIQNLVNRAVEQGSVSQERANAVLAAAEQKYGGVSTVLQRQRDQLEQLASIQKTVNSYAGISLPSADSASRGADIAAYGKQLDDLRAKYNPVFAASQSYKAALTEINQAAKVGALSEKERAEAVMNTKVAFVEQINSLRGVRDATDASTASTAKFSAGAKLARYDMINLGRQIQDVGVSLAGGQNPLLVGIQQIPQALDVLATSGVSVKSAFSQMASAAASVLTPMRLVAAGALAVGAGATYAAASWSSAQSDIERALIGIGRQSGTSGAAINKFASDNATATGLSVSQARDAAIEFARTGQVAVGQLKGLGDAVYGFSILTGKDATESAKTLASALSGDLVKGAQELNQVYGALDGRMLQFIATLQATGEKQQAQQIILRALDEQNKKAADSVGFLTKAWNLLGNEVSATVNQLGKALTFNLPGDRRSPLEVESDKNKSKFVADSQAGDSAVKALLPQIEAYEKLLKLQEDLNRARDSAGAQGLGGFNDAAAVAAENAAAATKEALQNSIDYNARVKEISQSWGDVGQSTALALQSLQNQLPVAQAITGEARRQAQYYATINGLMDKGKPLADAVAIAQQQYTNSQAQSISQATEQTQQLADQNQLAQAYTLEEQKQIAAQQAYNDVLKETGDQQTALNRMKEVQTKYDIQIQKERERENAAIKTGNSYLDAYNQEFARTHNIALAARAGVAALSAETANAADEAERMARAFDAANESRYIQASGQSGMVAGGDTGSYQQQGSFSASNSFGFQSAGSGSFTYDPLGPALRSENDRLLSQTPQSVANAAYANGGIDASIAAAQGYRPYAATGPYGQAQQTAGDVSQLYSQVDQLYQLKNAQTNDPAQQAANLREELAWLQSQKPSIERDQQIIRVNQQLIQALKDNTDATNANTAVTLNPFYTQGHSAVPQFGYYKAAGGMDEIVSGGTPGVDSVPYHLMLMPGERLRVDPVGKVSNDNDGLASILQAVRAAATTVQNNFFDLRGISTSNARRSRRQFAQGFGQASAAMGR